MRWASAKSSSASFLRPFGSKRQSRAGICLLDAEVADLTEQEVVEVCPVGFLRVEGEGILAFLYEGGIEAPQVPGLELARFARRRTALYGLVPSTRHSLVSRHLPSPRPGSYPYRPWPSDRGSCVPLVASGKAERIQGA